MTTIPASFNKHGFLFRLFSRTPKAAVYEQVIGDKVYAYEAHRVRVRKAGVQFGKPAPASEYLAGDAEWGVYGKTYSVSLYTRDRARSLADAQAACWTAATA